MEHSNRRGRSMAWTAASEALDLGIGHQLRLWFRRYANPRVVHQAMRDPTGAKIVMRLAENDPDGWRAALVVALERITDPARAAILDFLQRFSTRELPEQLRHVSGSDVSAVRGRLLQQQAERLYVRTFGRVSIHRGSWSGPEILIDKKRVRSLLAALAAQALEAQSRDELIDRLWPTADGDSAVNSLNQTVFQLRRHLDREYRAGDSPEYVSSTAEVVELNPTARSCRYLRSESAHRAHQRVGLGRAQPCGRACSIADPRRLPWRSFGTRIGRPANHLTATMRLRRLLLPIANARADAFETEIRMGAATALLRIDPYDEAALLALATSLAGSGKRIAARNLVLAYADRVRSELDDEPSDELLAAMSDLGTKARVTSDLTQRTTLATQGLTSWVADPRVLASGSTLVLPHISRTLRSAS